MATHFLSSKFVCPLALLALGIILLRNNPALYVTGAGQSTVVFDVFQGLEKDRIEDPGITVLAPFIDRPISYETRTRVWDFTDLSRPNRISTAITVNSADGQAFSIDVFVALHPNPAVLDDLHASIGENYMNTIVVPGVRSKVRDISAEFDSEDFYQKETRVEIEQAAKQLIGKEMPKTLQKGEEVPMILIEGIFFDSPSFPEGLKDSLERKQVAAILAETAAVQAEIQTKETERRLILAEANQQAIELKGRAAAANAQLADLLFFETLERRIQQSQSAGQSPPLNIVRIEGDSTVFLNVDPQHAEIISGDGPPQ